MWVAYVYSVTPGKTYFIEGEDNSDCEARLVEEFCFLPPTIKRDIFQEGSLQGLLNLFCITKNDLGKILPDGSFFYLLELPKKLNKKQDGEFCKFCKNYFAMSEPNQKDGSLVCWSCRDSNSWKLEV